MSDTAPAVFGFGVIFVMVGALGGHQLGLLATVIFLAAGAVLLVGGGTWIAIGMRRRAALPTATVAQPAPSLPTVGS